MRRKEVSRREENGPLWVKTEGWRWVSGRLRVEIPEGATHRGTNFLSVLMSTGAITTRNFQLLSSVEVYKNVF